MLIDGKTTADPSETSGLSTAPRRVEFPGRLRVLEDCPPGSLVIHEIYRSLQGESTYAGLPCVFVRLSGCHLRCGYCDTPHAFGQGAPMTLDAIVEEVLRQGDDLVEVTGGEPLLQADVHPLMAQLADLGKTVLLETSGTIDIGPVDPRVRVILDLKTPGSGELGAYDWANLDRMRPGDELKVVVNDRADFDWAAAILRDRRLAERFPVLFGAVQGQVDPADLAAWLLESRLPARLQLQLHKILWGPDRRGV